VDVLSDLTSFLADALFGSFLRHGFLDQLRQFGDIKPTTKWFFMPLRNTLTLRAMASGTFLVENMRGEILLRPTRPRSQ
jgi:hypothetical protein